MTRTRWRALAALGLALALAAPAQADPIFFSASLSGANERPNPVNTPGTGEAFVGINDARDTITFSVNFQNLLANAVAAHIHVGSVNVAGPVILDFTSLVPNAKSGSFGGSLTAVNLIPRPAQGINNFGDAVNAIIKGNTYVNVHTTQFPGGEIRGQLFSTPEPGTLLIWGAVMAGAGVVWRRRKGHAAPEAANA